MQGVGAKVYLTTYYGVGVTSAAALAFGAGFGLEGLWMGMTGGVCVSCLMMIYVRPLLDCCFFFLVLGVVVVVLFFMGMVLVCIYPSLLLWIMNVPGL